MQLVFINKYNQIGEERDILSCISTHQQAAVLVERIHVLCYSETHLFDDFSPQLSRLNQHTTQQVNKDERTKN